MYVELLLCSEGVRGWHLDLVHALTGAGATVRAEVGDAGATWGRDVDALYRRERRLHDLVPGRSDRVAPAQLPTAWSGPAPTGTDSPVVLDLTGGCPRGDGSWTLTFDDVPGEAAAVRALLAGRFPVVRVTDHHGGTVAEGRPGSEYPGITVASLEDVLAGCVELLLAAVLGRHPRLPEGPAADAVATARTPAQQARRAVRAAAVRQAYRRLYRTPHWRVGWRFTGGPGVLEKGELPADGWNELPDDGAHFYADPFPIVVGDRTYLFLEDFEHRVGRGVISVVEFDGSGPVGTPRPVLEHEVHLSYPFVLEDGGHLWMIPETSAAGTVELYRAVDFPDRWVRDSVLLRDIEASDVTPFCHDGRWWLSATVRHGGSWSDALHLWHADSLSGPWTPHASNPVLVDICSARPAGRVEHHDGRLLRPAQDGSSRYGGALALTEILELDPSTYVQQVLARLEPGQDWPGTRLHTINRAGELEVIDGSARSPRLRLRRRT